MLSRLPLCVLFLVFGGSQLFAQGRKPQTALAIAFPDKEWGIEVDAPGFFVKGKGQRPDGRQYLFANNPKTGVILSVMLQQSAKAADGQTCPDYLQRRLQSLSKLGFKAADAQTSVVNSMDVLEYVIAKAPDMPVQQKNVFACLAKDDIYIDVHLSKAHFQAEDEAMLLDVLNNVRITGVIVPIAALAH